MTIRNGIAFVPMVTALAPLNDVPEIVNELLVIPEVGLNG